MPPSSLEVAGKDGCRGSDFQQDLFTTCQSQKYLTSGTPPPRAPNLPCPPFAAASPLFFAEEPLPSAGILLCTTLCWVSLSACPGFLAIQTAVTRAISRAAWKGSVCEGQADTLITTAIQMPLPPYHRWGTAWGTCSGPYLSRALPCAAWTR